MTKMEDCERGKNDVMVGISRHNRGWRLMGIILLGDCDRRRDREGRTLWACLGLKYTRSEMIL